MNRSTPVPTAVPHLTEERLERLRDLIPEAFSEGRIDFEKLQAALGHLVDDRPERYSFSWAGKRDAIRLLQTPTRATLIPARDESVDFDATQNLFIEGDNLEVLKLLYKPYFGRVKLIYIDPPYNTGNDFIYPDDYADPLGKYLELTGQQDAQGNLLTSNPETSGRYHSAWLSMMYPRLFLARQLLREDGVIFVSIDDHEAYNLRMLMNEVFGEENFVAEVVWKNVYGGGPKSKHVVAQHEYILCYSRNINSVGNIELPPDPESRKRYTGKDDKFPIRGPYFIQPLATTSMDFRPNLRFPIIWNGEEIWPEKQWQWSKERVEQALANDELVIRNDSGKWSVRYKQYLRDEDGVERGSKLFSILIGPWTQEGTAEISELFGDGKTFPFPKPSKLIKHLISSAWQDPDALILDFFAGSCSTAQAVLELNREYGGNRKFILVQFPEPTGNPEYPTIAEIGKERIRRVITRMKEPEGNGAQIALPLDAPQTSEDLGFRVFKLALSHFKPWVGVEEKDATVYTQQMELFRDPLVEGWTVEGVLAELAIKHGFGLDYQVEVCARYQPEAEGAPVEFYRVSDPERGQSFYACLATRLTLEAVAALNLGAEDLFICCDAALDDETAANLALQCRLETI